LPKGVLENAGIGDSIACGAVPVPLSIAVCGEPVALSTTESIAVKVVVELGVKVMLMLQELPVASDVPQGLAGLEVRAKSDGLAPVMEIPVMVSGAVPGLERTMV